MKKLLLFQYSIHTVFVLYNSSIACISCSTKSSCKWTRNQISFSGQNRVRCFLILWKTTFRNGIKARKINFPEPDVHPPKISFKSNWEEPSFFRKYSHSATWTLNMCRQYVSHLYKNTGPETDYTVHSISSTPKS